MSFNKTFLGVLVVAGAPALMGASLDSPNFNQSATVLAFSPPSLTLFLAAERPGDGGANHDHEAKDAGNAGAGDNQQPMMPTSRIVAMSFCEPRS